MRTIVCHQLRVVALVSVLLAVGLASPAVLAQQRIGIDSAVNPKAMGYPPAAVPRRLVLGQDVVFNERVKTEEGGQTQILFVDESTLSVGPNANMVIDQFVYDPNSGAGKFAANLTRGVFRFVGGKLSKQDNAVTMRTPTATIGIRGGVMLVDLAPGGRLSVIFVYGKGVTITGLNGASQTITRPGFAVTVSGPGASPSDPAPAPPGATAALLAQLNGRAGGTGGAPTIPTEITVANSGIANVISANLTASIQAAAHAQPPAQSPNNINKTVQYTVPPTTYQVASNSEGPSSASAAFTKAILPVATPLAVIPATSPVVIAPVTIPTITTPPPVTITPVNVPSTPPVTTAPPVTSPPMTTPPPVTTPPVNIPSVAGGYYDTGTQGTALGFSAPGSPYAGGTVVNGMFSATFTAADGKTTDTVKFPLVAGGATLPTSGAGTESPLGAVTGVTYLSQDNSFFFADLIPVAASQSAQRAFIYGGTPVSSTFYGTTSSSPQVLAFAVVPDLAVTSPIPFIRTQTGGSLAGANISPIILETPAGSAFSTGTGSTKALQASLAISGTGTGQSSAIVVLVGNVTGNPAFAANPAFLEGVVHGSYLATATGQPTRINTYYQTPADTSGNSFYGSNGISGFVLSPGAGAANATEINTLNQKTTANYQFVQSVVPVSASTVATTASTNTFGTAQNLTGWFGGVMTKQPNGGTGSPIPYPLTGQVAISTFPTDLHMTATLSGGDPLTTATSGIANNQSGMVLQFGSASTTAARQAYINNNLFAALESPDTPSTVNGTSIPVSTAYPNTNPNIYLVTQTAAPPTSLLPNGLCSACQYLQWGYWGGEIDTPASTSSSARVDVGHINSWIAGIPTSAGDISSLKGANFTGSYAGNLFGSVVNGSAQYLASGGLSAMYNFGTGSGSFAVSNYDGLSFKVTGTAPVSGSNYAFGVNSATGAPGLNGIVAGTFYGPMAAETGGSFAFSKTTGSYFTSGIFAAKR